MEESKDLLPLREFLNKKYLGEENVHFVGLSEDVAKYQIRIGSKWSMKKFKKGKK